jgi:hypothetical protein
MSVRNYVYMAYKFKDRRTLNIPRTALIWWPSKFICCQHEAKFWRPQIYRWSRGWNSFSTIGDDEGPDYVNSKRQKSSSDVINTSVSTRICIKVWDSRTIKPDLFWSERKYNPKYMHCDLLSDRSPYLTESSQITSVCTVT